MYYTAMVYV